MTLSVPGKDRGCPAVTYRWRGHCQKTWAHCEIPRKNIWRLHKTCYRSLMGWTKAWGKGESRCSGQEQAWENKGIKEIKETSCLNWWLASAVVWSSLLSMLLIKFLSWLVSWVRGSLSEYLCAYGVLSAGTESETTGGVGYWGEQVVQVSGWWAHESRVSCDPPGHVMCVWARGMWGKARIQCSCWVGWMSMGSFCRDLHCA